jgi:Putative phage serine protease XkdF
MFIPIKKSEAQDEQRMVWGEVYAPGRPDSGKDFMSAEDIRKAAYDFVRKGRMGMVDVMHDNTTVQGVHIVESFIAREDDKTFIPGSWVVGVHVDDDQLWDRVKKNELNGFSLEAMALTEKVEVEIEIPPVVSGSTSKDADHVHKFYVSYDDQGTFLGGRTDMAEDGHFHVIKAGTITETVKEHSHRFSSVDDIKVIG